jgi:SDR family mycofactocin-dependent oxidoreductase
VSGRFEGKVAFVTGAARGQGRSHAVRLAEEGAAVIAVDLCSQVETSPVPMATPADLEETVSEVQGAGGTIIAAEVDVRDYEALKRVVDDAVDELGRLDIVAANAGIVGFGEAHELSERAWADMIDINLTGVWQTTKVAIPHVIAGGRGGSITLTSSVGGMKAYPRAGHYVAAKHGVVGLMRTLALELAEHQIRVNSVHPTQVYTPMLVNEVSFKLFRPDLELPTIDDFAPVSQAMNVLPVPWVEAVDVSNAVLFLASDEARYITGVTLPIDAGCLLH